MPFEHVFAGNPLDRAENERRDPAWLAAQLTVAQARVLLVRELRPLSESHSPPALAWRPLGGLPAEVPRDAAVLLGLREGVPHLVLDVTDVEDALLAPVLEGGAEFVEARTLAPLLTGGEAGVLAQARSLLDWHVRHGYCAACGAPTRAEQGGSSRRCDACGAHHFPRVDPVVIALVTMGDRCLLGSPRARGGTMFTCIAGFMEPGESIEEAVRREVGEEAGVAIGEVLYHSSQPWPFPASLMIGCHADAVSEQITVDAEEIADARWFERAEVARAVEAAAGGSWATGGANLAVPPPMTIAHQLIRAWALPG